MTPIIAILGGVDDERTLNLKSAYAHAVENSGGLPIAIPYTENEETLDKYIELCDGVLFSGGCDIEPKKFGEETKDTCGKIQLFRDKLEFSFFEKAFRAKKPIMGICRGVQLINVALGGSIYQDIPSEIATDILHRQKEAGQLTTHEVGIISDTPLMELIGEEKMPVNSFHHQSIKALGEGLEVMAFADDGIIEAVYHNGESYIMGYQWHPEKLLDTDPYKKVLFDDFIKASKEKSNEL